MTRLDAVIEDIKEVNKACGAWIYDADGNIEDDVICGNVLELLYELRDYELDLPKGAIDYVVESANRRWNTYNWNANIDHDYEWSELNSRVQYKTICDGRYCVDIDIMTESYTVWDNEKEVSVGEFYEFEVEDLLKKINKDA